MGPEWRPNFACKTRDVYAWWHKFVIRQRLFTMHLIPGPYKATGVHMLNEPPKQIGLLERHARA